MKAERQWRKRDQTLEFRYHARSDSLWGEMIWAAVHQSMTCGVGSWQLQLCKCFEDFLKCAFGYGKFNFADRIFLFPLRI
jgi:hypothetical protein